MGHDQQPAANFLANPNNWRLHPIGQQSATKGSLEDLGWIKSVIVNRRSSPEWGQDQNVETMVDGHLRVTLALREGDDTLVPVEYVDLSPNEERIALLVLDPISALAETDKLQLKTIMQDIQVRDESLQAMLDELAKKHGLDLSKPGGEDPGPELDRAGELQAKWGTADGQLWILGNHRILCGDATSDEVMNRLMGDFRAQLIWTDPPYGVNYGAKLKADNAQGYKVRTIQNDDMTPDALEAMIRQVLQNCSACSVPGGAVYVACPAGELLPYFLNAFRGSGFVFHWGLVWMKDQIVLGRGDYHFQHENMLYGWKDDGAHYFTDNRKQSSVFEYDRPKKSEEHPTMKPVELVEHMIQNSSQRGKIVLDPFMGSGTTIIACERVDRQGRGIEINPAYLAVTLERWSQMTGKSPELQIGE